ncbi:MAG: DUF6252 family protein [Gemmatimonadaceae bacterium]
MRRRAFIALLALMACHADSPTTANRAWYFRASVDGVPFEAHEASYALSANSSRMQINGVRSAATGSRLLTVTLNWKGTGSYSLDAPRDASSFGAMYDLYVQDSNTGMWSTQSNAAGTAIVTELDAKTHWVAGTFSFTALHPSGVLGSTQVTSGRFGGYYVVEP